MIVTKIIDREDAKSITSTDVFLESLSVDKNYRWIKLLCEIGNFIDFQDIWYDSKSEILAIMKYRRLLRQQGKTEVSFIELNTAYENKNNNRLHSLLERMFLESITQGQLEFILEKIDNTENGLNKVYDKHTKKKEARILNVILTL